MPSTGLQEGPDPRPFSTNPTLFLTNRTHLQNVPLLGFAVEHLELPFHQPHDGPQSLLGRTCVCESCNVVLTVGSFASVTAHRSSSSLSETVVFHYFFPYPLNSLKTFEEGTLLSWEYMMFFFFLLNFIRVLRVPFEETACLFTSAGPPRRPPHLSSKHVTKNTLVD